MPRPDPAAYLRLAGRPPFRRGDDSLSVLRHDAFCTQRSGRESPALARNSPTTGRADSLAGVGRLFANRGYRPLQNRSSVTRGERVAHRPLEPAESLLHRRPF